MQRNIRNEIYMALGALVIISFALVFAIILSGSIQDGEATEETAPTQVASHTETTTVSPTDTAEPRASDTETILIDTETSTAVVASETLSIVIIGETESRAEPSASNTAVASATDITIGETEATAKPSASNTAIASATKTATIENSIISLESSPTLTMIRLDTVLAPLNPAPRVTSRAVENPTKTATITYSPTAINVDTGIIPTPPPPTPTVVSLDAATRTASTCQRPQGWTTYTVQAGNTLFAIALATNSTVDELRYVNCIANVDNIIVGDVLFVPRKPAQPIRTPMPSLKRDNLYVLGCSDARTLISNLQVAQTVAGVFNVYGSAFRDDFWYYKIEIRPDWANVYNFFSRSDAPVNNDVLTSINPALFGEGLHWIRLSVVNRVANVESDAVCEIPVIFG